MSKIRINDLARELEVKSKSILDVLPEVGVTEKKTHSSSLEDHEADKVRARLRAASSAQSSSRSSRPTRADADEIKTKIDLSNISKPGDALRAIISKQQGPTPAAAPPVVVTPPVETKPAASVCYSGCTHRRSESACCSARSTEAGSSDFDPKADFYGSGASGSSAGCGSGSLGDSDCAPAYSSAAGGTVRRSQRRAAGGHGSANCNACAAAAKHGR